VTPLPRRSWKRADQVAAVVWGAAIVLIAAAWQDWAEVQIPPNSHPDSNVIFAVLVAPLLAMTLLPGFIAGLLIRRNGPKMEILALACVGAACLVSTVSSVAASDPAQCSPNAGCDLSYGFGALILFPFAVVPFLAGTAAGRGVSVLLRRAGR
jgi:cation transport ATPase